MISYLFDFKLFINIFIFILLHTNICAENRIWSDGTALTLPKGRYEFGIFQPIRYGINDKTELATYLIENILIPNISVKKIWDDPCCYFFATKHSFYYPTTLLKTISKNEIGGIMPSTTIVPELFVFSNCLILSKNMSETQLVTTKFGANIAIKKGNIDMTTIDLPVIFPRTFIYQNGLSFNLGIDFAGRIKEKYYYLTDMDFFILGDINSSYAFENKVLFIWRKNDRFSLYLGYKLFYGEYPNGSKFNILPLIDLQWGRN